MSRQAACRGAGGGFTLVELLVAMTLIGLMFVALFGGLSFGTRVWETGVERGENLAEVEVTQALLRRQLDQLIPLPGLEDRQEISFLGEADRLTFTAPAPSQFGLGGIYVFELFAERAEQGQQRLVMRWELYRPDRDQAFDEKSTRRTLLENIETLQFGYYGDPREFAGNGRSDNADWRERWVEAALPPRLIAVRVGFPENDARYWPELTIAPRMSAAQGSAP